MYVPTHSHRGASTKVWVVRRHASALRCRREDLLSLLICGIADKPLQGREVRLDFLAGRTRHKRCEVLGQTHSGERLDARQLSLQILNQLPRTLRVKNLTVTLPRGVVSVVSSTFASVTGASLIFVPFGYSKRHPAA